MSKKLIDASKKFYVASWAKLLIKEKEGRVGWDNKTQKCVFTRRICNMKYPFTQKDLIDMANYCNFLWNLIEEKKNETNTTT